MALGNVMSSYNRITLGTLHSLPSLHFNKWLLVVDLPGDRVAWFLLVPIGDVDEAKVSRGAILLKLKLNVDINIPGRIDIVTFYTITLK